jgi:predicted glycogen debranching enzyme
MDLKAEWLEADGLGGFASGTVSGIRTRRYHALLLAAATPPAGRMVLINGLETTVTTPSGTYALSSHHYGPDVIHPDGHLRIASFTAEPWPRWIYRLEDGTRIEHAIVARHGSPTVAVGWRLLEPRPGVSLHVRPLLSGRDYHATHHQNDAFRFQAEEGAGRVSWQPYADTARIYAFLNGAYRHAPDWYRNFVYQQERERGLDCAEDLASPGVFQFDLAAGPATLVLSTSREAPGYAAILDAEQQRRRQFPSPLHRAADAYVVQRGNGKTIVAGYPWFTDWGRDTFIALRGLCLAAGRCDEASAILLKWADAVSEGMLPNRFPDRGEAPEYNSVDASLWYVVAVYELLKTKRCAPAQRQKLLAAVNAIVDGYTRGTRYGIRQDRDGLLLAGEPGVQLTWMDAKIADWVVTPRTGKPVEVQALWLNALKIAGRDAEFQRGRESFARLFWNEARGCLFDVADPDDPALRPNQILAIGGLPFPLLDENRARQVVDCVERHLWTPLGLRSLAPSEPGYRSRYEGGVVERDSAYHQGTVWPWLLGPFVEAWVRVRDNSVAARREAAARFLAPLEEHLQEAGLGHVSEIADAEPPHTPRGCPFQAWSVGELLRLKETVLKLQ